jgi:hypothetical protein
MNVDHLLEAQGYKSRVHRRARPVCKIVKACAERIRLKATDFGAHSLRAGFLTSPPPRRICGTYRDTSRSTCCRPMFATPIYSGTMRARGYCRIGHGATAMGGTNRGLTTVYKIRSTSSRRTMFRNICES